VSLVAVDRNWSSLYEVCNKNQCIIFNLYKIEDFQYVLPIFTTCLLGFHQVNTMALANNGRLYYPSRNIFEI
jgi:hypothetical protein